MNKVDGVCVCSVPIKFHGKRRATLSAFLAPVLLGHQGPDRGQRINVMKHGAEPPRVLPDWGCLVLPWAAVGHSRMRMHTLPHAQVCCHAATRMHTLTHTGSPALHDPQSFLRPQVHRRAGQDLASLPHLPFCRTQGDQNVLRPWLPSHPAPWCGVPSARPLCTRCGGPPLAPWPASRPGTPTGALSSASSSRAGPGLPSAAWERGPQEREAWPVEGGKEVGRRAGRERKGLLRPCFLSLSRSALWCVSSVRGDVTGREFREAAEMGSPHTCWGRSCGGDERFQQQQEETSLGINGVKVRTLGEGVLNSPQTRPSPEQIKGKPSLEEAHSLHFGS
nr:uncharacterized protein LOC116153160 isoform X2 [Camelus dromedarius]